MEDGGAESPRLLSPEAIERRAELSEARRPEVLAHEREDPRERRRRGAGPADAARLPARDHHVSRRVGIRRQGDVRQHPRSDGRNAQADLIARSCKDQALASAAGRRPALVPHDLAAVAGRIPGRVEARIERRPADGHGVRRGGERVHRRRRARPAGVRTAVARRHHDGLPARIADRVPDVEELGFGGGLPLAEPEAHRDHVAQPVLHRLLDRPRDVARLVPDDDVHPRPRSDARRPLGVEQHLRHLADGEDARISAGKHALHVEPCTADVKGRELRNIRIGKIRAGDDGDAAAGPGQPLLLERVDAVHEREVRRPEGRPARDGHERGVPRQVVEPDDAVHGSGDLAGQRRSVLRRVVAAAVAVAEEADRGREGRRHVARRARDGERDTKRRVVDHAKAAGGEPFPDARVLRTRRAESVRDLRGLEPAMEARRARILLRRQHRVESRGRAEPEEHDHVLERHVVGDRLVDGHLFTAHLRIRGSGEPEHHRERRHGRPPHASWSACSRSSAASASRAAACSAAFFVRPTPRP